VCNAGVKGATVAVIAAAASGCGGGSSGTGFSGAEQSRLCTGSRQASDQLVREHPELPAERIRAMVQQTCATGFHKVPQGAPRVAASSAGCAPADDVKATPISRRRVAAPDPRAPYFAPRAGVLPRSGAPTVAGIRLPTGSRCAHYWASNGPTPDALQLARRLAAVFPQTGLWPVIWDWEETPDHYRYSAASPRAADRLRAAAVLQHLWDAHRSDGASFPGLAAGSRKAGAAPVDAFGTLAESEVLESPPKDGWVLVLTPVNRPADAIATLGFAQTEILPDADLTAIARSWEERFGAVLASAGPGTYGFAVSDPPHTTSQALALAAEQDAVSPDNAQDDDTALARALMRGSPSRAATAWKGFWSLGWPD
jgi:hypothetical protein